MCEIWNLHSNFCELMLSAFDYIMWWNTKYEKYLAWNCKNFIFFQAIWDFFRNNNWMIVWSISPVDSHSNVYFLVGQCWRFKIAHSLGIFWTIQYTQRIDMYRSGRIDNKWLIYRVTWFRFCLLRSNSAYQCGTPYIKSFSYFEC